MPGGSALEKQRLPADRADAVPAAVLATPVTDGSATISRAAVVAAQRCRLARCLGSPGYPGAARLQPRRLRRCRRALSRSVMARYRLGIGRATILPPPARFAPRRQPRKPCCGWATAILSKSSGSRRSTATIAPSTYILTGPWRCKIAIKSQIVMGIRQQERERQQAQGDAMDDGG